MDTISFFKKKHQQKQKVSSKIKIHLSPLQKEATQKCKHPSNLLENFYKWPVS